MSEPAADSMNQVINRLYTLPRFSKGSHMDNCARILRALGNPQDRFRYVHVAGTNGKGSVCAFLSACLAWTGCRVGVFTSPHLVRIHERIRILRTEQVCEDPEMDSGSRILCEDEISDAAFLRLYGRVKETAQALSDEGVEEPTFFEYMYLMAMLYFDEQAIDIAVVETGLGGRLDFTNLRAHPDLCIITSVSLDHTAILGDSIRAIAYEKAGIIKPGCPVVYDGRQEEAACVIRETAAEQHAPAAALMPDQIRIHASDDPRKLCFTLDTVSGPRTLTLSTPAVYQAVNASLAFLGLECLWPVLQAGDEKTAYETACAAMGKAVWHGRMEELFPDVYVDGGHNPEGITAFTETVRQQFSDRGIHLVFAAASDKDGVTMIRQLCSIPRLRSVTVTRIDGSRGRDLARDAAVFEQEGAPDVCALPDPADALARARGLQEKGELVCCVGSLYLVGDMMAMKETL